ncbi:MAG: hypothetical protein HPY79_05820 [Bacteroidales bacterium]|nr:hypothetical protein [Bacteroidales bacterium]
MKKIDFASEDIESMREVLLEQLQTLIKKVEKIKRTLDKIGYPVNVDISEFKKPLMPKEIYAKEIVVKPEKEEKVLKFSKKKETITQQKMLTRWEDIEKRAQTDPAVKEFLDIMNDESIPVIEFDYGKKSKKNKKEEVKAEVTQIIPENYRRKKNILWSDYVYDVIRLTGYPLTVNEINERAIKELSLDKEEQQASFSAIHSSLFRLKRNQKSINNYAIKGSRTSYYGLAEWFTKEGKLLKKYARPF